jgi:hypothetical protein
VGAVAKTFRTIAETGQFVPVAVCGRDERLRKKLGGIAGGLALGWRNDMPALMAAADVLVENAGGLTSMEALSVGLPIISYKPIAGHGKENTSEMDEAGVSRVAHSSQDLLDLLDLVSTPGPERMGMIKAGWAMFRSDPADHVLDLAADGVTAPVPVVAPRPEPRRPSVLVARMAAAVAAVPLLWAGLTTGVGVVTAYGAGVAHPRPNVGPVAYLGVRRNEAGLTDPGIQQQLAALNATAVVDRTTAELNPNAVQHLVSMGVDVESGGAGERVNSLGKRVNQAPWVRAEADLKSVAWLTHVVGQPVKVFVPGRRVNAFDLVASYNTHSVTVVPNHIFVPDDADAPLTLDARHIYMVNGVHATNGQVTDLLFQLAQQLRVAHLSAAPLVQLH